MSDGLQRAQLLKTPARASRTAKLLALTFLAFLFFCLLVPIQQAVSGEGRVIAFTPSSRRQKVDAPVDGRVRLWHVQEGSKVVAGQKLADMADNDSFLMDRLNADLRANQERLALLEQRAENFRQRFEAVGAAQNQSVIAIEARLRSSQNRLQAADQAVEGANAEATIALTNLERHRSLFSQGLVSSRDLELSTAAEARSRTQAQSAVASRNAAAMEVDAARATLEQSRSGAVAEVQLAETLLRAAEADIQTTRSQVYALETRIARQSMQQILSPIDGTVLRILTLEGNDQVKAGDVLAWIVPTTEDRAVEIWIDGNDAPLVAEGRHVRLQFEGWPALQFVGWPQVALGTFGGRVAVVDAADDGSGDFRVMVVPEPHAPWPETRFLRQGVRANGWVLLNQVSAGYEIWRRINGFPPSIRFNTSTRDDTSSGNSSSGSASSGSAGSLKTKKAP